MNKNLFFRILLFIALVGILTYLFIHFDLYLFFEDKNKVIQLIKSYPHDQLIFILLQTVQVIAAPIPGELTGLIGGYIYGPFWGTIYSTIGLTLGSWLAFLLARFFGEPLLEKIVKKEVFEKFDHFMEHKGIAVSFLLFLIPGFPKDYLCYIMGVSRIPTGTFIIVSTIGRFFGTMMLSITGNIAQKEQYRLLAIVVVAGIAVFALAFYYRDRLLGILKNQKNNQPPDKTDN